MLLALVFVGVVAPSSVAAPLCVSGSLADYLSLIGGCDIGGVTVADFTAVPVLPGVDDIPAADITVTPVPGLAGFDFGFSHTATAPEQLGTRFRFSLTGGGITGGSLALRDSTATDDGVVTALEFVCVGGSYATTDPSGCAGSGEAILAVAHNLLGADPPDLETFGIDSFFDVFVEITIDGGPGSGSASLGVVRTTFASVPEPASFLLIGIGAAAWAGRRKFHS
jgi:hypothetical protein